ncbi:hypothetical protein MTO96_045640 [Rhipicephalus appendiculatus]
MGPRKTASKPINWKYPNASPSLTVIGDSQTKHIYQYFDPTLVGTPAFVSQCGALIGDVPGFCASDHVNNCASCRRYELRSTYAQVVQATPAK